MRQIIIRRILWLVLLVVAVGGTGLQVAVADKMYWADVVTGKIQRANLDGSDIEDVVVVSSGPYGIAIAPSGNKLYWGESPPLRIQRANLDGSEVEEILGESVLGAPAWGIALDLTRDKMYWTGPSKIDQARLDGSDVENFVATEVFPRGLALDAAGEKLYWTTIAGGVPTIQRANLDASGVEVLVSTATTDLNAPWDIELDVAAGKMYWVDSGRFRLRRANLDGSDVELLVTAISQPKGIALDLARGKVYWTSTSKIQRANLDGSEVEDLVTGLSNAVGIALQTGLPNSDTCIAPPPDIVSWWPGDGDALDIINANDGELRDGVTFIPGRVGPAFTFGYDNDLVTIGDPSNLQISGDLTIMTWVFPLPDSRDPDNHIFARRAGGCSEMGYQVATVGGFLIFDTGGGPPIGSGLRVPDNEWSLVAVVHHAATNTVDFYVNDRKALDVPGRALANPANADIQIGQANGCPLQEGFEGLIDEVVIFDRALSTSEINDVFFAGSAGMCKPAVVKGSVIGVTPDRVICKAKGRKKKRKSKKKAKRQKKIVIEDGAKSFDCVKMGLQVESGDKIKILINGTVD